MHTSTDTARVYIADLSAYNNGTLHGAWIDLDTDAEFMREQVAEMLQNSPEPGAEEFACHDSEFVPSCVSDTNWDELAEYAEFVSGCPDAQVACQVADALGYVPDADNLTVYHAATLAELGEELAENYGYLQGFENNPLVYHIDWEGFARDQMHGMVQIDDADGVMFISVY